MVFWEPMLLQLTIFNIFNCETFIIPYNINHKHKAKEAVFTASFAFVYQCDQQVLLKYFLLFRKNGD